MFLELIISFSFLLSLTVILAYAQSAGICNGLLRLRISNLGMKGGVMSGIESENDAASITATILEEEEARKAALDQENADTVLPDDLLPGV